MHTPSTGPGYPAEHDGINETDNNGEQRMIESEAKRGRIPAVASGAQGHAGGRRRALLKAGAGVLAGAVGGPAVHAQEKIVLRYMGTAVNQDKAIAERFEKDTGIGIQYVAVTTDDVTKRAVTAPNSFDLIDTEYFSLRKIIPTGNLAGIDTKRIKNADKITSLFTTGMVGSKQVGDQGTAPKKVIYVEGAKPKKFATAPTQYMTLIPTTYNADTLGIRPDLIKRPIESWAELLNPEFKGRAAILNIPSIGIMDAAMVVEAMGIYRYPDKGNMTKKEIDLTIKTLIDAKRAGQFRSLWKDFNESVNLMASGEVVIQSMWSPAVTAVRTKGTPCVFQPLKEGYRAWAAGFGLPSTLSGRKLDGAYEFINWFLDGWAGAYLNRQGYYSAVLETAKSKMEPYEWAYWMEGKPAEKDIKSPGGDLLEKAGNVRDGGSYEQRMGGIACWNAVMDENNYMVQKWNEFVAA
jgi:putative spermidine/putrescine transport system substrate-binding protein